MRHTFEPADDEKKPESINEVVFAVLEISFGFAVLAGCVMLMAAFAQYFG